MRKFIAKYLFCTSPLSTRKVQCCLPTIHICWNSCCLHSLYSQKQTLASTKGFKLYQPAPGCWRRNRTVYIWPMMLRQHESKTYHLAIQRAPSNGQNGNILCCLLWYPSKPRPEREREREIPFEMIRTANNTQIVPENAMPFCSWPVASTALQIPTNTYHWQSSAGHH